MKKIKIKDLKEFMCIKPDPKNYDDGDFEGILFEMVFEIDDFQKGFDFKTVVIWKDSLNVRYYEIENVEQEVEVFESKEIPFSDEVFDMIDSHVKHAGDLMAGIMALGTFIRIWDLDMLK